jgi:aryl-alcohol dehydrogenase-like predicted oxidoreductase
MRTRRLGRTGLIVSELALGAMTFGKEADEQTAHALLDRYADAGGNLVDAADVYQAGVAEEIIGRWFERRRGARDSIVLATKCRFAMGPDPNQAGLTRRWILRACEDSLRRLRTDYIDLYQAHAWDPLTPIEESLAAFGDLVRAGKVQSVGVSNFTGWQLQRAILVARQAGLSPVVSLQPQYNLLAREIEWELLPLCADEGIAVLPWSPLGQGWLTGKYSPGERPTGATRLGEDPNRGVEAYDRRNTDRTWRIIDTVKQVAAELDATPAQVALRWVADRPAVTAPIVGARTVRQLEDSLGAGALRLDGAQRARLDEVSAPPTPDYPYGFIDDQCADRARSGQDG